MDTNDTFSNENISQTIDEITKAHAEIDHILSNIRETVAEAMLDEHGEGRPITKEKVIAQIIMEMLDSGGTEPAEMTADKKAFLVRVADHMGPDWAQALYHAAVFITKVA